MQKTDKNTLSLLFVLFIFFGIAFTVIDPLIPIISEEFNIGYDKIGLILFASSSISLIATFLSGRFSDKYDLKKIIMTGALFLAAGFMIYGFFLSLIILALTVIFFRVGCGILDSSIHAFVSKLYYKKHSAVFVKLDLFWYIGAVIGPLLISILLYLKVDIRYAFIGFFISIVIVLVLFLRYYSGLHGNRNKIKNDVLLKTGSPETEDIKDALKEGTSGTEQNNELNNYIKIVKNPVILLCSMGLFFYIGIFSLLSTWLTTYFADFNIPVSFSSAVLSVFWAFNAIGIVIAGRLIRRFNELKLLLIFSIVGGISAAFYSMLPNIYVKIFFLILQAIFYSSFFPLLNAVAVHEDARSSGTILGITLSISVIGLVFFQPVSGAIMEYFGTDGINYLLLITAFLLFLSIVLLYKRLSKKPGY